MHRNETHCIEAEDQFLIVRDQADQEEARKIINRKEKTLLKFKERLDVIRNHDAIRAVRRQEPDYQDVGDCCFRIHSFREDYEHGVKRLLTDMKAAGYQESLTSRMGSCLLLCLCPCWNQCLYDHQLGQAHRYYAIEFDNLLKMKQHADI